MSYDSVLSLPSQFFSDLSSYYDYFILCGAFPCVGFESKKTGNGWQFSTALNLIEQESAGYFFGLFILSISAVHFPFVFGVATLMLSLCFGPGRCVPGWPDSVVLVCISILNS